MHTHHEVVREIHEDYIRAGARVIITNTFGTNRQMLEGAGLGGEVESINRRASGDPIVNVPAGISTKRIPNTSFSKATGTPSFFASATCSGETLAQSSGGGSDT